MSYPPGFEPFHSAVGNLRSEIQSELHRKADNWTVQELKSDLQRAHTVITDLSAIVSVYGQRITDLEKTIYDLSLSQPQENP